MECADGALWGEAERRLPDLSRASCPLPRSEAEDFVLRQGNHCGALSVKNRPVQSEVKVQVVESVLAALVGEVVRAVRRYVQKERALDI